jgi:hypothetical protein
MVFATRADAICADYKQRVARLPRVDPSDMKAVHRLALLVLAIARRDVGDVHALLLPTANQALAREWLATRDRLVVLLGQLTDAAGKGDAGVVARITAELDANGADGHRLARRLGMKVCSVGG